MMNLLKLLQIEWLKLKRYKAFILLLSLTAISIFGLNYMVFEISQFDKGDPASMLLGSPFQFPNVWNTVSWLSSFLLIIPGLIIILLMSNEYTFRTHRQNIIDGVSRTQFILTKIVSIILFSVVLTLFIYLVATIFGLVGGERAFSTRGSKHVFYFFIQSVSYLSVALVLVLLFKRSGISIGVYFLYAFIIENVLGVFMNRYIDPVASQFLPLNSVDALIPMPGYFSSLASDKLDDPTLMIISCTWIILCLLFCKHKFEKSDL